MVKLDLDQYLGGEQQVRAYHLLSSSRASDLLVLGGVAVGESHSLLSPDLLKFGSSLGGILPLVEGFFDILELGPAVAVINVMMDIWAGSLAED